MLKRQALLLSVIYSIALAALSLFKVSGVTQEFPSNSDKFFHAIAYTIFTIIWFFAFHFNVKFKKIKAMAFAASLSVAFGILIEFLQGALTKNREADLNDVIANTIGTIIALIVITTLKRGVKKE